ncbi:MAG: phosphoenolpyruvate carboxylase [Candidatus Freyarchaeota archaeon]|nr:phosphoenolpyruvate carboxylase [Candidatus Jordarchaeia archaeon]
MRIIPCTMSTQHPDNANVPQWCKGEVLEGEDEVYEAFFAFSELGCHEVMWDAEGKDVDTRVIRKLLLGYGEYFEENVIGERVFLTYRLPNPKVEEAEKKIMVESLINIPVSYDVATKFYGREVAPIFEVILPFTTDARELIWLHNYYKKSVVGMQEAELDHSVKAKDWVGYFKPNTIEIIPLIEDMESLTRTREIVEPYLKAVQPPYLRVFLARSDPALNYGIAPAVLLSKIALSKLKEIEEETGISIYPIIGVGTMPFRGHLSPANLQNFLEEYRGVRTVTIQSALKYDYPIEEVKRTIRTLNTALPHGEQATIEPHEEQALLSAICKLKDGYQEVIVDLAPLVNSVASYVPKRRSRKLHIGLFGYSRSVGGITLPRAIPFAAALYTIGIPPEIIGLRAINQLNEEEWDVVKAHYLNVEHDIRTAAGYISWDNINMLTEMYAEAARRVGTRKEKLSSAITKIMQDIEAAENHLGAKPGSIILLQRKHENIVNNFLIAYFEECHEEARRHLQEAAKIRRCLG